MSRPKDESGEKKRPLQWVTRAEAGAVLLLALVFIVWTSVILVQQRMAGERVEVVQGDVGEFEYLIDINKAEPAELTLLPAIGKVRAERIVTWRDEHGPFRSLEELKEAARLSTRDMDRIRGLVTLSE